MLSRDIRAFGEDDARVFAELSDPADSQGLAGLPDAADPQVRVGLPDAADSQVRVGLPNTVDPQGRMGLPSAADSQVNVGAEPAQPARFTNAASGIVGLQPMSPAVAAALNDLNRRFYAEQASSFSSTRRGSWAGWNRALDLAGFVSAPEAVVDVACGNMRFESYLAGRFPGEVFGYIGIDNCPNLVGAEVELHDATGKSGNGDSLLCVGAPLAAPARLQHVAAGEAFQSSLVLSESREPKPKVISESAPSDVILSEGRRLESMVVAEYASCDVILSGAAQAAEPKNLAGENAGPQVSSTYLNRDIVDLLLNNRPLALPSGDLVVCFGFMHHVPGQGNRRRLFVELLASVVPGGVLVVSFWQFMTASGIAAQALELTESSLAALGFSLDDIEPSDYILGWQNSPTARRYCHNFTLDEVRSLTQDALDDAGLAADFAVSFFEADGRNNHLNCYLVAKRADRPEGRSLSQHTAGGGSEVSS